MGDWATSEREAIDGFFRFSPTHARYVGDHRFDGVVGDLCGTSITALVAEIDRPISELRGLDRDQAIDRSAMFARLQPSRFELTDLGHTLGKLLIPELRQDFQRKTGSSLKRVHDAFLGCGPLPIPLIRELIS